MPLFFLRLDDAKRNMFALNIEISVLSLSVSFLFGFIFYCFIYVIVVVVFNIIIVHSLCSCFALFRLQKRENYYFLTVVSRLPKKLLTFLTLMCETTTTTTTNVKFVIYTELMACSFVYRWQFAIRHAVTHFFNCLSSIITWITAHFLFTPKKKWMDFKLFSIKFNYFIIECLFKTLPNIKVIWFVCVYIDMLRRKGSWKKIEHKSTKSVINPSRC